MNTYNERSATPLYYKPLFREIKKVNIYTNVISCQGDPDMQCNLIQNLSKFFQKLTADSKIYAKV